MEKKPSWVLTLVTQVSLCFCLYLAFQLGQPRSSVRHGRSERRPLDLYFISVGGGFRPPTRQTHLLKQMEKVANKYKADFVVDVSDLGEDDPLMQNGSLHFSSLKVPWYTTRVSEGKGGGYFLKKINLTCEKTLDVILVDTGLLQNLTTGSLNEVGNNQSRWLRRTLEETSSTWRVVVGFHPLAICESGEDRREAEQVYESLRTTFTKFEVNAYLSVQGCANSARLSSLSYIRNPGKMAAGSASRRKLEDGFFLHRVSSLEIETYFVTSAGEVSHRSVLHQRGKEIM